MIGYGRKTWGKYQYDKSWRATLGFSGEQAYPVNPRPPCIMIRPRNAGPGHFPFAWQDREK
jgi:hypothetical protein